MAAVSLAIVLDSGGDPVRVAKIENRELLVVAGRQALVEIDQAVQGASGIRRTLERLIPELSDPAKASVASAAVQ